MFVPDVEAAVEDYYRLIQIPKHIVTALRDLITTQFNQLHAVTKQERHAHILERDELRGERTKLLQAHYAGAIPLDLRKTEQDRIARRLAHLDARIEAADIEYEQAKAHLDDCLALAGDCHALYMSIDDDPGTPFNVLFNPEVHHAAIRHHKQATESRSQTGNVAGLNNDLLVELRGVEPLTFSLRTRRATNCATAPEL